MTTERTVSSLKINFCDYCPYLLSNGSSVPIEISFDQETSIASERLCPNGGLPGVEKRSESGFLVPINPDKIVVYCEGCDRQENGFEVSL